MQVHNQIENGYAVVLPLYAGGIAWTLVYDTIYAHQDKNVSSIYTSSCSVQQDYQCSLLHQARTTLVPSLLRRQTVCPVCCVLCQDDALLGLGTTALTLGDGTRAKLVLGGFSSVTIGGLLAAGNAAGVGAIYYPMIALGAGHLAWRAYSFQVTEPCVLVDNRSMT